MIEVGSYTLIIGERINPTGRKVLAEELQAGSLELVVEEARRQAEAGADVIDVNVGTHGVNEPELLPRAVLAVHEATGLPVCADSSDPLALRAAIAALPDELLVNSVTGDQDSLEEILPAVAETEAILIGITKDRSGIPKTAAERMEIASRIVDRALALGIPTDRILLDLLAIPVATDPQSANITLECIRRVREELGVGTVLGASNISFGMPTRDIINAAFLSIAIKAGLSAAIVNPLEPGIVQTMLAADVVVGLDQMGRRFFKDFRQRRKE